MSILVKIMKSPYTISEIETIKNDKMKQKPIVFSYTDICKCTHRVKLLLSFKATFLLLRKDSPVQC